MHKAYKSVRKIFGFIWALYTLFWISVIGIVALFFFLIFYNLGGKYAWHICHHITKIWAAVFMALSGLPVVTKGRKMVDRKQTQVFVCNHVDLIDVPAATAALPGDFTILAKNEVRKIPIIGYMLPRIHYSVIRSDKDSRKKSFDWLNKTLLSGRSILLYPEGTRNAGPQLTGEFHSGAFRLAIQNQLPLTVVTMLDTYKRMNKRRGMSIYPGPLRAIFSAPISTVGMRESDVPELMTRVKAMMEEKLRKVYGDSLPDPN